jgi:sigma-54 dependent transcriptional regulator, acetoin dehydrogenase operon transcriptional activator AcoR
MGERRPNDAVAAARRQFFEAASMPEGLLAPAVLRSWTRCAEAGLDAHAKPKVEPLSARELADARERQDLLRRIARPEIASLKEEAAASDSIVILTDADGVVLDAVGDAAFAGRAAKVALTPGGRWSETGAGTNAIGTALCERRPVQIIGGEHYFDPHRVLSCWATPIFGPHGEILGVLDVSAPAEARGHELALVRLAAEHIEHRMFDHGFEECDVVRLHSDKDLLGSAGEGVLVFANDRLVAANRVALKLISANWSSLNTRTAPGLFADRLEAVHDSGRLRTHTGSVLHARMNGGRQAPKRTAAPPRAPASAYVFDAPTDQLVQQAVRLIEADAPFLVLGEAGTGKESFIRAAHERSTRNSAELNVVSCREGFHGAPDGLVLLDGVDALDQAGQAALLIWVSRRGENALIATSRIDLADVVAQGAFNAELYHGLASYLFTLTPLRDSAERISIVRALWRAQGAGASLDPEAEAALAAFNWPGNMRQLALTLRALAALARPGQAIRRSMLPPHIRDQGAPTDAHELDRVLDRAMRDALSACNGNVAAAARRLGIHRSTFYRRGISS